MSTSLGVLLPQLAELLQIADLIDKSGGPPVVPLDEMPTVTSRDGGSENGDGHGK